VKQKSLLIAELMLSIAAASRPLRVGAASTCIEPPSGLVSWWPGDTNKDDLSGLNNPNAESAVTLVPGEVLHGFSLGTNGYLQVAPSESLANQTFTWAAWVKLMGPGPNNDGYGSALIIQDIDDYDISVGLYWRALTSSVSCSAISTPRRLLPRKLSPQAVFITYRQPTTEALSGYT